MRIKLNKKGYWKMLFFKRGILLQISLTMKCNYDCDYCSQKFVEKGRVQHKEVGFISWVRFFKRFPYKIKEVYVSGGEPTLHKDFVRIVKYLLGCGYHVKVFTNLKNYKKILELPQTRRLCITTTYHHHVKKETFLIAYNALKNYQIKVDEIGTKILKFSNLKTEGTKEKNDSYMIVCLRISPNLRINISCFDLLRQKLDYEKE